jgi:putative transposase
MQRRHAAQYSIEAYCISAWRACQVIGLQRASWVYKAHGRDVMVLLQRLHGLAQVRVRYGSQRFYNLLRRES